MADLSLDEVIRRRNFPVRGAGKRPPFARGAGPAGRAFDARHVIGSSDMRQRLGVGGASAGNHTLMFRFSAEILKSLFNSEISAGFPVKDAREKLGSKDARFRLRGRGGSARAVQDARHMINLRKQQVAPISATVQPFTKPSTAIQHVQMHTAAVQGASGGVALQTRGVALQLVGGITKVIDARNRLSLKRSVPAAANQGVVPLKITKTIQQQRPVGATSGIRINVPSSTAQRVPHEDEDGLISSKQMKITTSTGSGLQTRPLSLTSPITKVVKNDSYTPPSAPVAPARPPAQVMPPPVARATSVSKATTASKTSVATQPMTRDSLTHTSPQPVFSPLEGTKMTVNNLHPRVTEEDIVELFCVCGALKRARLLKVGVAEVVFVRKEDAIGAYRKYNNRCLDGQPMKCNLHIQGSVITSEQPILLRLSDSPGSSQKDTSSSSFSSSSRSSSRAAVDLDPQTVLKALFKSSSSSSGAPANQTSGDTHSSAGASAGAMAPPGGRDACVIPGGFTVLSLRWGEEDSGSALHQLCVKEHRVRSESNTLRPLDRTLFVLNVPPNPPSLRVEGCSVANRTCAVLQAAVRELFSRFGAVESVELCEKPGAAEQQTDAHLSQFFKGAKRRCFKVAYVVFRNPSSVETAKRHPVNEPLVVQAAKTGLSSEMHTHTHTHTQSHAQSVLTAVSCSSEWIEEYSESLVKASSLQEAVDQFMISFDTHREQEVERRKKEAELQQEDEEGWVKVTKSNRSVKLRPHSESANQKTLQREDRKRKRKELLNFYSWQHRNTQREHIAELRKKFEEDKQRIALLRAQRKFRPY
ncbi:hypothetical protein DNTS_009463 [Danionella cerebrum]|uniref:RRM domain-containing protein n=1 Tax=Danionella cerebrum TaxID=2873325 RepID=A0A553PWU3_9TELE|nr:hypothetical protein DNTS_009463 [Danionella translucida]